MAPFRPDRWLPLLRSFLLALVALGMVLQPVMASAGEMHELAHDPAGTHGHELHADELAAELAAADEQDQRGARTLHVLLHLAHCCGGTAALSPRLPPLLAKATPGRLAGVAAPLPPAARLPSPFKPPIFA